jgi:phosphoglucosamine mutase
MQRCGKPLSELKACMTSYPQVLINAPVRRRAVVEELPRVQEAIRSAETSMGGKGRILVRLSGTEPVARVMVEGEESAKIERLAREIALVIEKELG